MIETVFLALGLVLVAEGLVYALAPSLVEQMLAALRNLPEEARRLIGMVAVAVGLMFLWVASLIGG